jgi:hypothetical protein
LAARHEEERFLAAPEMTNQLQRFDTAQAITSLNFAFFAVQFFSSFIAA